MKQRARLALYALMLAGFGAGAVFAISDQLIPNFSGCRDWLCSLADPIGLALLLMESGTESPGFQSVQHAYHRMHGTLVIAALLLALCAVRGRALWRTRGASLPPEFAGFPLGVASFGAVIYLLESNVWVVVPYPLLNPPRLYGTLSMLLALLLTEGSTLIAKRRAAQAPAHVAGEDGAVPEDRRARSRRRPIWTIAAVSSPAVGVLLTLLISVTVGRAGGYAGMAAMGLGMIAIAWGLACGAVATIVAVARRERWPALQVTAFLVNFGVGVPLLLKFM